MAASSFCSAVYSWDINKPVHIIKYSFNDLNDQCDNDGSFHTSNEINGEFLQLARKSDSPCTVEISCNDAQSAQINGISILSESRTLEISSNTEGYIATVRGERTNTNDGNRLENQPSQPQLYRCSYVFSTPKTDFQVKFMSLGNKDRLLVQSVNINIHQHFEAFPKKALSTFDMGKLKSDIEEMGDSVSEKALEFFKTLELYEQNKSSAFGNMFERVDQENQTSTPKYPVSQSQAHSVPSNDLMSQGLSSIMESVLGHDMISSLSKRKSKNGGNGNVFSMLQAVCGEVSKMRKPACISEDVSEVSDSQRQVPPDGGLSDKKGSLILNSDLFMQVENRLEMAKTEMRKEIQSAKEEVMSKLQQINHDMDHKMNLILNLLQTNLVKENVSQSQSVPDTVTDMDR